MKQPSVTAVVHATIIRDELLRYVKEAIGSIRAHTPTDSQIHRARKQLKRARANLRLLRDVIGKATYTRENVGLRDAARPLSGVRDAAVLGETANSLIQATRRGPRRRLLLKVRRALEQARLEARAELRLMNAIKESTACLEAAAERIRRWKLKDATRAALCSGLQRTYRRGRDAFAMACAKPSNEHLHEWRKQVKYLGQSLDVWNRHGAHHVKRDLQDADKLAKLLGADHDLAVIAQRLDNLDSPHPVRPAITRHITDQRSDLLKKVLKKGQRLFKAKPRPFVHNIVRPY
ncbi:MAG: CHAD domain-containing protein [Nitrospira sp.]